MLPELRCRHLAASRKRRRGSCLLWLPPRVSKTRVQSGSGGVFHISPTFPSTPSTRQTSAPVVEFPAERLEYCLRSPYSPCGNAEFKEKMICGQQRWDRNCVVPRLVWSGLDLPCLVLSCSAGNMITARYPIYEYFWLSSSGVTVSGSLVPTSRGRLRQLPHQPFHHRQAAAKKDSTDSGGSSWILRSAAPLIEEPHS